MPALDFTEIPPANGGRSRDSFELFARDFLALKGFQIVQGPDRGPDAGRDLIVEERRTGPGGTSRIRWLVSCKHNAHSGKSVMPAQEPDLNDRLSTHQCDGFIAFYSTLPSSGLTQKFNGLPPEKKSLIFDSELIEEFLLRDKQGHQLASRFMPKSYGLWVEELRSRVEEASGDTRPKFLAQPPTPIADSPIGSESSTSVSFQAFRSWRITNEPVLGSVQRRNSCPLAELIVHFPEHHADGQAQIFATMTQGVDSFNYRQGRTEASFEVKLEGSRILSNFQGCSFARGSRLGEDQSCDVKLNGGAWELPGFDKTTEPVGEKPLLTLTYNPEFDCALSLSLVCSEQQIDVTSVCDEASGIAIPAEKAKIIKRYVQRRLAETGDGMVLLGNSKISWTVAS